MKIISEPVIEEYCCPRMVRAIDDNFIQFVKIKSPTFWVSLRDPNDKDRCYHGPISFCPFCGEKIEVVSSSFVVVPPPGRSECATEGSK